MYLKHVRKISEIIRVIVLFIAVLTSISGCRVFRRPGCDIIEPQDRSFFGKGELIEVLVEAEDPNGNNLEVQFYINGEGVGSTTTFPYRYRWDTRGYEEGEYRIRARVIDVDGWTSEDSSLIEIGISAPVITTEDVSGISLTSAVVGGSIQTNGGAPVFETGIYFSKNENPQQSGERQITNLIQDDFITTITGLATNTNYFYTAYAVNDHGESTGEMKKFRTLGNEIGTFTDVRDGKTYNWVRIANQTWMAENLAFLPLVNELSDGSRYNSKYYVYNYNSNDVNEAKVTEYYSQYGVLYNYEAALKSCPAGWHLPSDEEFKTLESNLGMTPLDVDNAGWRGTNEGRSLKARSGWKGNGSGSNISDFSAVASGYRLPTNVTDFENIYANYWVAREYNNTDAWSRYLYYGNTGIYRGTFGKDFGFSVRCIKD